jgi:hypothetical protein
MRLTCVMGRICVPKERIKCVCYGWTRWVQSDGCVVGRCSGHKVSIDCVLATLSGPQVRLMCAVGRLIWPSVRLRCGLLVHSVGSK